MSRGRILAFILGVYALLAGIAALFPQEGITAGPVSLDFPGLADLRDVFVPAAKAPAAPSPEELIAMRKEAARQAEGERFEAWLRENPARIHFPDDDPGCFDALWRSLDNAGRKPVRILHYGDSQIEEDRISSTLRAGLQERFGGGGPGLLPYGRPYYTQGFSQTSTAELGRAMVFGEAMRRQGGRYGIMGQLSRLDTTVFTGIYAVKNNRTPSRYFRRMTLLAGNISGSLNVKCGSRSYKLEPLSSESGVGRIEIALPDSSTSVKFSCWGGADIYGVSLDDTLGVGLDNIPMRGCAGTVFTRMSDAQIKEYAQAANVRLILLQFGGNAMPYRKSPKAISEYKTQIENQIRHLQAVVPDAAILFIGPSDMSTSIRGRMQTYPHLPMMVDSLKAAALGCGAAFWDMYEAMGGENSMSEWVKARPQLAGSDHVHFTPRGAEAIGDMLLESLLLCHDYYRWRSEAGKRQ